ncbi:hypothetical protein [Halodesulfovibrio marinisediminis]|uniref:Uncharacterized protein n=1 Tax=Halodesulfovibrio marinisediminis DSM 17456 TaxID=1121457 RepID=A0A1N6HZJ0_9BACT|nr:hypothetical protein [Halodesulfovibrio marinisediminis]SIO25079.1 hypothetical protein SAMN02745161_2296 [Halodesulfovibrio marinisediminis DSM 17456]
MKKLFFLFILFLCFSVTLPSVPTDSHNTAIFSMVQQAYAEEKSTWENLGKSMRNMMDEGTEAAKDAGEAIKSGLNKAKKDVKEGVRDFKKGWNEQAGEGQESAQPPSTYESHTL